ncbi:MAG TPA: immunoglobulin domain-containing protein, partial [Candidatus Acidoferrales bacterium]|nr:immunoglobulin domain-containing protein [Candidatus Acidoferrales bacterium]
MPPNITQNNPTGIATTDGTNFWGTGSVTGTNSEAPGTLFYNTAEGGTPTELQNYIQAAAEARIINGVLYVVVSGGGVYNFLDGANHDALVPLPEDPDVLNPVEHPVLTNLFINWGSTFTKIANFDMNPAGTIAYGADQTKGIVKFVNNNGNWQFAYYYSTTNLGTKAQSSGNQGCFGICVDFSGANPIIYATTMENGQTPNSQGNRNQNRLIRIVDAGVNPGTSTNLVQTLATASTTNEYFGGIDFTPDLRPLITSVTPEHTIVTGAGAAYTVTVQSAFPVTYQWLQNGSPLGGQTVATLSLSSLDTSFNGYTYQCIVSNAYGAVTSTPPSTLTVDAFAVAPTITNTPVNVTGFVETTTTFAPVTPGGTEPFTYQWYHGTTNLTDDGVKYSGSTTPSLTISNLVIGDSGNYSLVVNNGAAPAASNVVDILTVQYHLPAFTTGYPVSATTFVGLTTSLTAPQSGGSLPITNQWYKGTTALSDTNEISGSGTSTLTVTGAITNDAGSYKLVVSNPAGSVTSSVATITVLIPPAAGFAAYPGGVYKQNFDSLPDPGSNSVNSFNNPMDPGSIITAIYTNAYSLANPFDFTFPIITGSYVGGLGLSNTMKGWYGAADTFFPGVDGITRFAAQNGDQTTGGVIDFGPNDGEEGVGALGTNRALGLLSTSTTGSTSYALKLVNTSTNTLNYISLGFTGELWHNGTTARTMSFGYSQDNTATNFTLTAQSISNSAYVPTLAFSFPTAGVVTTVDGTQLANQTNLGAINVPLNNPWPPGGALWLIWSINFYGSGGGNGYAIDNLLFSASTTPELGGANYSSGSGFSFSFVSTSFQSFTVYSTPSLIEPINWTTLGTATETPNADSYSSTYTYTDSTATGSAVHYYKVVVNPPEGNVLHR